MLPHVPVPQPTVDFHHLPVRTACTEKRGNPTFTLLVIGHTKAKPTLLL
jgi:hypothetical protein